MAQPKDISNFRRRRKLNLIAISGNKCQICGFDKFPEALEFHHENPAEKSYGLSTGGVCHSLESDLAEVKKCFLVCANCHRGIHAGYYNNPTQHIFDEVLAQQLLEERDNTLYNKQQYFCIDCGREISAGANRCPECAKKATRFVDRPTRDELKLQIRTTNFVELGRQYGVSDNAVRKWCKAYNLPHRATDIKQISDEDWLTI